MHRLIGFCRSASDPLARKRSDVLAETLLGGGGWREVLNKRGARLLVSDAALDVEAVILPGEAGLVLGAMFRNTGAGHERVREVSSAEVIRWSETNGEALTGSCWGGYLVVMLDPASPRLMIIRDPTGARPCFVSAPDDAGVRVVFTDAADFARLSPLPDPDYGFLAMFVAQPRLVTDRTALSGVCEVLAGECAFVDEGGLRRPIAWRPPAPLKDYRRAGADELARSLRRTVCDAVGAWTQLGAPIVHRLSGGLDSSIALAALMSSAVRPEVRCIAERPAGFPEGDETGAAKAVADQWGCELTIVEYRPEQLEYAALRDAPLSAKPSLTELSFADQAFVGATGGGGLPSLLTSGQGGDQVFYRSNAVCVAADAVRDWLPPAEVLCIALNAARASRRSIYPVLAHAFTYGLFRPSRHYARGVLEKAADAADAGVCGQVVDEALSDDWVCAAERRGPGEVMRALHLSDLQYYHGPSVLTHRFVVAPVLTSQPIVELCCQIPVYRTVEGGRDRGLARMAFATDLPANAVDRRRKGDTTRFFAAVARANASFLREMLCGGELEQNGLFDPARLEKVEPTAVLDFSQHLIAELWLRRLKAARQAHMQTQEAYSGSADVSNTA